MNVLTHIFDGFVDRFVLKFKRCCSESTSMKVSDLIIYIMKIMRRDSKNIRSSRFRDVQKALKVQTLSEVALIQVVRKRVSF